MDEFVRIDTYSKTLSCILKTTFARRENVISLVLRADEFVRKDTYSKTLSCILKTIFARRENVMTHIYSVESWTNLSG